MFSLLEKLKGKKKSRTYCLPEGMRIYAVGDIHGRADLLERLHRDILRDAQTAPSGDNLVIYLGDYLDRGPYVRQTLDTLIAGLPPGFRTEFLMGNHEQLFLDFKQDPYLLELWISLGGHSTLRSYQVQVPGSGFSLEKAHEIRNDLLEAMPREHLEFLENLRPYLQLGDYLFVHAGIRPGLPLERQRTEDLLWIRDDFTDPEDEHEFKVIHGHTIYDQIREYPSRIGMDTGAYATGILSCAVLEGPKVSFLSTNAQG